MPSARTYDPAQSVTFRKTSELFGGLSNMAGGFPIRLNNVLIYSSEALYQACRFPDLPDVQKLILGERSPMTAKMRSKPHRPNTRPDWDDIRIPIMKWVLRVKLANNWKTFGELLAATGDLPIVEDSRNDDFWGALLQPDGKLTGCNVLGRLLMELRVQLRTEPDKLRVVTPPDVRNVRLLGALVGPVRVPDERKPELPQLDLLPRRSSGR